MEKINYEKVLEEICNCFIGWKHYTLSVKEQLICLILIENGFLINIQGEIWKPHNE